MALISDTRPAVKDNYEEDEPAAVQEIPSDTEEADDELQESSKKRKKVTKLKVRAQIEAHREEDVEVSLLHQWTRNSRSSTSHLLFDQVCDAPSTTCVCCLSPRCLT